MTQTGGSRSRSRRRSWCAFPVRSNACSARRWRARRGCRPGGWRCAPPPECPTHGASPAGSPRTSCTGRAVWCGLRHRRRRCERASRPARQPTHRSGRGGPVSHPAADVLTSLAMVVLQSRPVGPLTTWRAEGLRLCSETRRGLQVVTPPESRITMPLRLVLTGPNSRWVVRADGGYYDGLTGVPLLWDGTVFMVDPAARAYAPGYTTPPAGPIGAQLTVTFRVRHTPEPAVGGAAEQICRSLTGEPPGDGPRPHRPPRSARSPSRLVCCSSRPGPRRGRLRSPARRCPIRPAVGTMLLSQVD